MNLGLEALSKITVFSKYAKYIPQEQTREDWDKIVNRYGEMMIKKYPALTNQIQESLVYIKEKKVLPSMRALQFAGPAAEVNNARIYNCCFLPIDSIHSFSETMFLLLGGTGVGYSVQKHNIDLLPTIKEPGKHRNYLIEDSIMGWADAIKVLMKAYLTGGALPIFDFRAIRHKGARLVTAGGKAPGPEPLRECLILIENILRKKEVGSKLTPLECHDILCHIANSVLSGGIRRSAMICLFDKDDMEMITCKSPISPKIDLLELHDDYAKVLVEYKNRIETITLDIYSWKHYLETKTIGWWVLDEQRGRANNSAVLERGTVSEQEFKDLWKLIENSNSGEPGIYWTNDKDWGTNPCCEIALRPYQFCNLCEVNVNDITSQEDLNDRVCAAAFFGTLQAGFTDFHYLRPIWTKTTQKDALLGIGMTGIGSGEILKYNLEESAHLAKITNQLISEQLGINEAARVTCIKPSGTTSCVLGTSSGIHAWYAPYYLRTIRFNKTEDIASYLSIYHPELCEDDILRPDTLCVRIPIAAPEGSIFRTESALETLERVKKFSLEWIKPGHNSGKNTHNVSATINIKKIPLMIETEKGFVQKLDVNNNPVWFENEWTEVGDWMWNNKDVYNGLSVLNYDNGSYTQAPFEEITKEEYEKRSGVLKSIDLTKIIEQDDNIDFGAISACSGSQCEINL